MSARTSGNIYTVGTVVVASVPKSDDGYKYSDYNKKKRYKTKNYRHAVTVELPPTSYLTNRESPVPFSREQRLAHVPRKQ
jgi:hypothetical protein